MLEMINPEKGIAKEDTVPLTVPTVVPLQILLAETVMVQEPVPITPMGDTGNVARPVCDEVTPTPLVNVYDHVNALLLLHNPPLTNANEI
jgi:hypothetical protein